MKKTKRLIPKYHIAKPTTSGEHQVIQGIKPIKVSKPITDVHLRSNTRVLTVLRPQDNVKGHYRSVRNSQGRNEKCKCGSGLKYKKCCIGKK